MKSRKEIKIEMKNIDKEMGDSPLNVFIKNYYYNLKIDELLDAKEAVKYKMNFIKQLTKDLKKDIKESKKEEKKIKCLSEYLGNLEYENRTNEEIIHFIKLIERYQLLKKLKKNTPIKIVIFNKKV